MSARREGFENRGQFLVPAGTEKVPAHPESRELVYNRIIIRIIAVYGNEVADAACKDVSFLNGVLNLVFFSSLRSKFCDGDFITGQFVFYNYIGKGQVAVIGNLNGVKATILDKYSKDYIGMTKMEITFEYGPAK